MKDTVVFSSPFKGEAGRGMGFDDLVCRPSRCFFLPHPHPDPLKGSERHSCDCHATNAHGTESHPLMMKHAKGELKARPSHPLRGPRLALHSQPAAAVHRMRCETPPRPLAGRLLIGSLRSISPAAHPVVSR
jgi:hypothetical protein